MVDFIEQLKLLESYYNNMTVDQLRKTKLAYMYQIDTINDKIKEKK